MGFDVAESWLHPEGIYVAQLTDVEETTGKFGPQMKWTWRPNEPREDGEPPRLTHWTGSKFSPKSNLSKMFTGIGLPIPEGRDEAKALDPNSFIGTRCRVQIGHDLSVDGNTWANIRSFAPLKPGATAPTNGGAAPPTPAPTGTKDPFEEE